MERAVLMLKVGRPGERSELRQIHVGRGSALEMKLSGVLDGVAKVMLHVGRPGTDNYSVVSASPLPDGLWAVYASGLHFPEAGDAKYHITGRDGRDKSVWLGCGRLVIEPSVLFVDEEDVPLVPEDAYVRNPATGMWHKLTVTVEDGVLVPEISNEGVTR